MSSVWFRRLVPLAVGTALLVSGCSSGTTSSGTSGNGVAAKSGSQIYDAAKAATASASSVRYTGHLQDSGKVIDIDIVAAGTHGGGTITVDGATLNIVTAGSSLYLKASAASWTKLGAPAAAAGQVADKWLQTSTSDQNFSDFAEFTNLSKLVGSLSAKHTPTKGKGASVNGRSAITLVDKGNGVMFVATTGKPYILEIESTTTGSTGTITFADYNTAAPPAAPSGAVSINALTGSG